MVIVHSYANVYQRVVTVSNSWLMHNVSWSMTDWWFGTMEFYDFPYIGIILPTDELHDFSEGGRSTTNSWISWLQNSEQWCFKLPWVNLPLAVPVHWKHHFLQAWKRSVCLSTTCQSQIWQRRPWWSRKMNIPRSTLVKYIGVSINLGKL